ncbi:hypothetical protein HMN09_00543200 [Mycena chlorophos]|uniref:Uncharacterized protein n=1 Tax=Mycena chlorophos TaxID=658473 RepID=A0A8H6TBT7_MYCCL|nr:hypothetical protein HMN09_00543200 [Mycena chlorophos]
MDSALAIPQAVLAALGAQPVPPSTPPNRANLWPEPAFPPTRRPSPSASCWRESSSRSARARRRASPLDMGPSWAGESRASEEGGMERGFAVMDGPYLYAMVLAALSLNPKKNRQGLIRHANFVLFVAAAVYIYRNVAPLATFTQLPLDHGAKTAATVALVLFAGIVVPLFTPRLYTPVDPAIEINPEQTASLFSFIFYFFLNKIIFSACHQSELPEDQLYALYDTDSAAHLRDVKSGSESMKKGGENKVEEPKKEKSMAVVGPLNNLVTAVLDNIDLSA